MFRKERFDQFGVEFLRDNFFMTRPFVEFHEYMIVARILKRPYFWIRKVDMFRWTFTAQNMYFTSMQTSWKCIKYGKHLSYWFANKTNTLYCSFVAKCWWAKWAGLLIFTNNLRTSLLHAIHLVHTKFYFFKSWHMYFFIRYWKIINNNPPDPTS